MQCPSCSTEIGNNTSFCPHCGTSLAAASAGAIPPGQYEAQPPYEPVGQTPFPSAVQPPYQATGQPGYQAGYQAVGRPAAQSGLSENMAGALSYVTIIPAILFLLIDPYKQSAFVRFHSFQSIFLGVAWLVLHFVLAFIPVVGWIIGLLLSLVFFVLWIFLLLNASKGGRFKVPVIGDLAEQQAKSF